METAHSSAAYCSLWLFAAHWASPYDKVCGMGMKAYDSRLANPAKWEGENLLGRACERVPTFVICVLLENSMPCAMSGLSSTSTLAA